ncbi:hypothetical protein [Ramlibacter sp. 2FC]|uniref:hypothetical protein n=1 Tax=Ramlibacter sp. 2FC TaxID=2502188 RepID=UPI001485426A|nr:hypothetical protein [Ramlibacter sp. 2FC]
MTDVAQLQLVDAWCQCERHFHHLQHAMAALAPSLPIPPSALPDLDDEAVQDWDQFVLRFTKLQDAMGARLFPAVLAYLQEPYEDRPMLDKLHRLEKLGYLGSVEEWHVLRAIRNRFAHDYPQDDALKAAYLNEAVEAVPMLQALLARIEPLVAALPSA